MLRITPQQKKLKQLNDIAETEKREEKQSETWTPKVRTSPSTVRVQRSLKTSTSRGRTALTGHPSLRTTSAEDVDEGEVEVEDEDVDVAEEEEEDVGSDESENSLSRSIMWMQIEEPDDEDALSDKDDLHDVFWKKDRVNKHFKTRGHHRRR